MSMERVRAICICVLEYWNILHLSLSNRQYLIRRGSGGNTFQWRINIDLTEMPLWMDEKVGKVGEPPRLNQPSETSVLNSNLCVDD